MFFYRKAYHLLGILTAAIGLALIPFMRFFTKDVKDIVNVNLVYVIFLANTVLSYFFSYKRTLISAYQQNYIVTVSDFVKDMLKYKGGVDIKSVTVKNVIDTERFKKSDENIKKAEEIRRNFGFKDDDTLCLFVGRLVPEKGIGLLVDAMGKTDNEKIKLLIAGGSAFADSKKTDFERSLYEAAGLVLLEAQSAEKPLIIANSGGMGEYVCQQSAVIIEKGDNFTDRLAEEITKLSNNKEKQCEMAKAGYEFSLNYNKENYLKNIAEAIKIVTDKQK